MALQSVPPLSRWEAPARRRAQWGPGSPSGARRKSGASQPARPARFPCELLFQQAAQLAAFRAIEFPDARVDSAGVHELFAQLLPVERPAEISDQVERRI